MHNPRLFFALRASLLAALGLSAAACGADVNTGGAGGGPAAKPCEGPPVLLPDGSDSGYVKCADGTIHRATAVGCDATITAAACDGTEPLKDCTTDADCAAKPHGRCLHYAGLGAPTPSCGCAYSCADDSECDAGNVCVCSGVVENGVAWSVCSSVAKCKLDADCPSGECGITSFNNGCWQDVGLACRSSSDACRVNTDCMANYSCVTVPSPTVIGASPYTCETQNCAIGRPLLVDGAARTAPAAERSDWAGVLRSAEVDSLDPEVRATLASAWTEIAALEHASIASFARFTLSLMALGAPSDLLRAAQEAALDEVEHARMAYTLASRYAGRALGPSKLELTGISFDSDARSVLTSLIREACVGETLGAAEALALAACVEDPALREVHARVAEDEARHAELAWKTLAFLLASGDAETKRLAASVFQGAIAEASADPRPRLGVVARSVGLLRAEEIGEVRRRAIADVVRPCANALLRPGSASNARRPEEIGATA